MAGPGTTKAIKYSLIFINIIVFLSGLIMLIGGSVVQGQIKSQNLSRNIGGYSTEAGAIICIIFGIFILLLSLFGLYATIKDHHRFLFLYSGVMSLIFVIQFITGIVGLSVKHSDKFDDEIKEEFKNDFKLDTTKTLERDAIQHYFKCCGWGSFRDYQYENNTFNVPTSCCKDQSPLNCDTFGNRSAIYFEDGCSTKLIRGFGTVIETACAILVTFSIFNLIGIVLSIILGRNIKSGYQYT